MDNYLIDRETLSRFVDELIKERPLPAKTPEELEKFREATVKDLDQKIGLSIFGQFTKDQNAEFNKLLDDGATEGDFDAFFKKHQIDVEGAVAITMKNFADDFLKGDENA